MIPKAEEYKKYFSTGWRMACINTSFLLSGSCARGGMLVACKRGAGDVFITKEGERTCLEYGLELYGQQKTYDDYISAFKKYIADAEKTIVPKYSSLRKQLTKEELTDDLEFLGRLWIYYGFCEFPYQDLAYETALREGNRTMLANLDEASRYKFTARELMNKYFFVGGVFTNLHQTLHSLFDVNSPECLYTDEMIGLFDGVRPSEAELRDRSECYAAAIDDDKITKYTYAKAKEINLAFTAVRMTDAIHGVPIGKGRVRGKAIVLPMPDDHGDIARIDSLMQKGDILVTETTSPDLMSLCRKAAAIVANQGGMLSHAAVVSRELGIPAVIQADRATEIIKSGDLIEVDGNTGVVRILSRK